MKREHRLRYIIKEGLLDTFYIWKDELRNVFKDAGVMIFFFLVPFVYPLLYSFIYNNEVVHEAKMVVVDQSDSYLSREFTRRANATPDVEVVGVCLDMAEAKKMLDEKKAYGILLFPPDYSKDLHEGRQTTVSLYCDMSALLFYKAFLLAATEVSLDMGKELRMHNNPSSTDKMDQITVDPIPYESVALFNSQNGFASFLVPAILILVLQQTLILGIGMLGGTAREKNRFHSLVPICRHFNGTLRIVFGKSLTYLLLYVVVCIWVLAIVPKLFSLPQVGEPLTILLFLLPYLFACIFMSMTLSGFMTSRESPMLVFVSGGYLLWLRVIELMCGSSAGSVEYELLEQRSQIFDIFFSGSRLGSFVSAMMFFAIIFLSALLLSVVIKRFNRSVAILTAAAYTALFIKLFSELYAGNFAESIVYRRTLGLLAVAELAVFFAVACRRMDVKR